MADSSFSYSSLFKGKTLMVIIPHEDDEFNIAGSTIHGSILEGIHVICVFSTWGDNSYTPDIRRREAVKSLSTLGVKEHDIIFLGYPDGGVHGEMPSIFMETAITLRFAAAMKRTGQKLLLISVWQHMDSTVLSRGKA